MRRQLTSLFHRYITKGFSYEFFFFFQRLTETYQRTMTSLVFNCDDYTADIRFKIYINRLTVTQPASSYRYSSHTLFILTTLKHNELIQTESSRVIINNSNIVIKYKREANRYTLAYKPRELLTREKSRAFEVNRLLFFGGIFTK